MGLDVALDVDYRIVDIETKDIFLLTTDGIHDFVKESDTRRLIQLVDDKSTDEDFEQCCEALIQRALSSHSKDNLSCQILRVDSLPAQSMNDVCHKLTELPFPPELGIGMILDGYRIEKEIHTSNRTQIYLVCSVTSGEQYCMKTPSVNYDDNPAYIERFILESWVGTRVNNSHVVKVVETHHPKSCLYYLTEYVEGITLEQWIKQNPKPAVQEVINLAAQIGKGLNALHRRETLHQDIKPGNIMIDKNGEVKIIDFGSCYISGIAEIDTPLVRDGILGTAGYSAPEVVTSGKSTVQSDVFSLAVLIFKMLTGEEPFAGKLNECRTAKAFLKTKYIPCYQLNPLVPIWIDGAVKKGLRYDPKRRYADIPEFLHELQYPNLKYKKHYNAVRIDKNPLLFWQMTAGLLFIALCVSLFYRA